MKLAEFQYDLPASSIAQEPVSPRDQSKLMVLERTSRRIEHRRFSDITDYLRSGDVLVLNSTKVYPARLRGKKKTGGKVEILLLGSETTEQNNEVPGTEQKNWKALVRGTTRAVELEFPEGLTARMAQRLNEGQWILQFSRNSLRTYLDQHGEMPLPPYIKRPTPRAGDLDRYQTVYAQDEGAVAAPTAGFHFTPPLLERIKAQGVSIQYVVLHVGWGTFRPLRTETIEDHAMLPETYDVAESTAQELNQARATGRRIIAVGTTVVRTLETLCDANGTFRAGQGQTNLFIYPGYAYKAIDALITNFHLPDSTPLLLASAFYGGGSFALKFAYEVAIRQNYRFYSYGDAMFIQ